MKKILGIALVLTFFVGFGVSSASAQYNYYGNGNRRVGTVGKVAIVAGIGAIVGGLIAGKKGAVVGGLAGAGGGYAWSRQNRYRNNYPNYGYRNTQPYYGSGYGNGYQQPYYAPNNSYYGRRH